MNFWIDFLTWRTRSHYISSFHKCFIVRFFRTWYTAPTCPTPPSRWSCTRSGLTDSWRSSGRRATGSVRMRTHFNDHMTSLLALGEGRGAGGVSNVWQRERKRGKVPGYNKINCTYVHPSCSCPAKMCHVLNHVCSKLRKPKTRNMNLKP